MSDTCTQPTGATHTVSTPPPGLDAALLGLFSQALRAVADSGRAVLLDYSAAGGAAALPGACRTGRLAVVDGAPAAASCGISSFRVAVVAPGPFTVRVTDPPPPPPATDADAPATMGPLRMTEAQGAALRGCKAVLGYLFGPECHCSAPGCAVPRVPLGPVFGAGAVSRALPGATSEASRVPQRAFGQDGDPEAFDAWAALWLPAVELLRRMPGPEGVGQKPSWYAVTGRAFALVAALYGWGLDNRCRCARL